MNTQPRAHTWNKQPVRPQPFETPKQSPPFIDHWVLQLRGVDPQRLGEPERLKSRLEGVLKSLNLTPVSSHTHVFGPGISTVFILAESHLSVHTWPELGYMHVDVVTCVPKLSRDSLEAVFRSAFEPDEIQLKQIDY